jgi:cyclopropane fatty-acyl-phospholipid synthase-like methyltransferase
MPSSYAGSFPSIVHAIIDFAPHHVLDIGPGWGKYGLACREYLPHLESLDAVEVPQGRYQTQNAIYDCIFVGDIRYAPEQFFLPYDLVLLIDVIEHVSLDDGHDLLSRVQRAGPAVLVSTPTKFFEQHVEENPYETHVSFWDAAELSHHSVVLDVSTVDAGIFLLKGRR